MFLYIIVNRNIILLEYWNLNNRSFIKNAKQQIINKLVHVSNTNISNISFAIVHRVETVWWRDWLA